MNEIAPAGYGVFLVHRPVVPGGPTRGGGLAVIHRNTVPVRVHSLAAALPPTNQERQVVGIVLPSSSVTIVNIYRPPSGPITQFLDELGDFLATVVTCTTDKLLLCGDFNCPGVDGTCVDDDLQCLLESFGFDVLVNEPTRAGNLLDILASDDP